MGPDIDISRQSSIGEGDAGAPPSSPDAQPIERATRLRWLIWSVLAAAYMVVMFHRVAPGVVADRLMAEFAASGTVIGVLTSIYFYMYAIMQIPSGALADTLGARKTVTIGASLAGLGSLVFGLAPALELAYLGRFLVGLGVSVIFIAAMKCQVSWFRAGEFGTVSGLLILAGNLGSITATTPVALVAQSLGWRASFMLIGIVTCAVAVAAWLWVRDHPSELGLPSPSGTGAPLAGDRPNPAPETKPSLLAGVWAVLRNRQTQAGFLVHFGTLGSYLTFSGLWAVPYLMQVYGMGRAEAANYLFVTSLGLLVSAPLAGHISDQLLRRRKLPIASLAIVACAFWPAMALWNGGQPPVWALYPLFGILGFSVGNVTLVLTSVKEANPPALAGLAMGTANGGFLCAALLQPALGYLLDSRWQGAMSAGARVYPLDAYQILLAVLAAFALLGLIGAFSMKETYSRN